MIYAAKVSVSPSIAMFIVITRKRYQNCLCHISFLVTRYPARAEINTISAVPTSVLIKVIRTEFQRSGTLPI